MKTRYLILVLLLAFGIAAQAQYKKYTFGLKASPHIGWMKPNLDGYEGNGAKVGFSWGFVSEIGFSENHCLATGFNIVFNGGNLKFGTAYDTLNGTMERNYSVKSIEIPLTLKMRTNPIGDIRYFGQIGLGSSFRINAKKEDKFTYSNTTLTFDKETYEKVAFLRESLIIGLGAEYTLPAGTILSAGLALNNGFTDMLSDKNAKTGEKEKATINFIELNIAVLF